MTEPSGSHNDAHGEATGRISNDPLVLAVILPMVVLAAATSLLARSRTIQRLTSVTPAEVL